MTPASKGGGQQTSLSGGCQSPTEIKDEGLPHYGESALHIADIVCMCLLYAVRIASGATTPCFISCTKHLPDINIVPDSLLFIYS